MVDVLSHGIVAWQLRNYELSLLFKFTNLDILIVLSSSVCFKLSFFYIILFYFIFDQVLLQDKESCEINMVKCCDKGRNYIHSCKKKSCANLRSVALSMTKYLLHGMTCNNAELLHSCGLMQQFCNVARPTMQSILIKQVIVCLFVCWFVCWFVCLSVRLWTAKPQGLTG